MRIALVGYGMMGRAVERLAVASGDEVVARIDAEAPPLDPTTLAEAEVAIEFAGPDGAPSRIREAVSLGLPVVSGSTGFDDELPRLRAEVAASSGALLHAPNLSIGVALFERIIRYAASLLDGVDDYALALEETHHTRKVDHPSGTARWLADGLVDAIGRLDGWEGRLVGSEDRTDLARGGDRGVLPVRSFREGDVPGTHTLRASGPDDTIELTHRATTRDGFARGALTAARWLRGRQGVFTLADVLDAPGEDPA